MTQPPSRIMVTPAARRSDPAFSLFSPPANAGRRIGRPARAWRTDPPPPEARWKTPARLPDAGRTLTRHPRAGGNPGVPPNSFQGVKRPDGSRKPRHDGTPAARWPHPPASPRTAGCGAWAACSALRGFFRGAGNTTAEAQASGSPSPGRLRTARRFPRLCSGLASTEAGTGHADRWLRGVPTARRRRAAPGGHPVTADAGSAASDRARAPPACGGGCPSGCPKRCRRSAGTTAAAAAGRCRSGGRRRRWEVRGR